VGECALSAREGDIMPGSHRLISVTLALSVTLITLFVPLTLDAADPQSPEQFLGHQVGADYKLAPWEKIVDYFRHMDTESERITVRDLGITTEGRPMILAEISDAATIANLTPHRENQRAIADPRLIANETEEQRLIHDSKVVILINCQLHSTEVASSQMAMEFAYDLVTGDTPEIRQILEHVIVILIPCANPDGHFPGKARACPGSIRPMPGTTTTVIGSCSTSRKHD
jgi:hypothetical protein